MDRDIVIREFREEDAEELNQLAGDVFSEFQDDFDDWSKVRHAWERMADLAGEGRIFVALDGDRLIGGVCYIGPRTPRHDFFEQEWGYIRSLVVDPGYRGRGLGTRLTGMCIELARKEKVPVLALVTSPIMAEAVRIYERLGFQVTKDLGEYHGVRLHVYCLDPGADETPCVDVE
jgi:ribosomal protein S18 acetylase RimI-like enzyme